MHTTNSHSTAAKNLRSLPPRVRSATLRMMLLARFPKTPRFAGLPGQPGMPALEKQRGHSRMLVLAMLAAMGVAGALIAEPAHAGNWRMDVNVASDHTRAWARRELNQRNPGIGLAWQVNRTWAVAGGVYSNSYRRPTVYALTEWTPLHLGAADRWHVDAGLAGGIATGYTSEEVPCAPLAAGAFVRIIAPSGVSLNLVGVPNADVQRSGFIGFQLSFPLALDGGR